MTVTSQQAGAAAQEDSGTLGGMIGGLNRLFSAIPHSLIALLARFSIAAVFWKSGQTKVQGLAIDLIEGTFTLGIPKFSETAIDLFKDEYKLPLLPPELAAGVATTAEHIFPVLILVGLATRLSALALLVMTIVIQVFVYPGAYPLHGVWAVALLYLIKQGPGVLSIDHIVALGHRA